MDTSIVLFAASQILVCDVYSSRAQVINFFNDMECVLSKFNSSRIVVAHDYYEPWGRSVTMVCLLAVDIILLQPSGQALAME